MPVGLSSPARNLFLLGSSGEQVVTNFFKTIDKSAGTDGVYVPDEIKYNFVDQKFLLAGSASDSNSKGFGWFEKRDQDGIADWDIRVEAPLPGVNTTLRAMELDINNNLTVVGKTGSVPWIAKYSNGGVIDWQSTTNSGDVEYTGITSDANGNYYACGNTPTSGEAQAFVEKFDSSGTPGWGKSAFMLGRDVVLNKVAANSRGEVVAVGYLEDDSRNKGYIVKIDTNTGEVLWDRTLETGKIESFIRPCLCEDVYIDSNDQIYVVGRLFGISSTISFIIKYTAEGNMIWQRETPEGETFEYYQVKSDGETEQTIVFGRYFDSNLNKFGGVLTKYTKNGTVVWRRKILSSFGNINIQKTNLDADASFYYFLYTDEATDGLTGDPDRYTFGKVSSSGNGLGDFEYTEGTGATIDYQIINIGDVIGRLSDGSVRQDSSDLITYPFSANKLLFDDLATQVSNKKRQMDTADSFEYSGSPAIRPADFQELNLLGDVYSGSGNWLDQSGKGNDGVVNGATWTASGWFDFDGVDDYIDVGDLGINMSQFTVEVWFKPNVVENYRNVIDCNYGAPDPADGIVKSGNIGPRLEMNSAGVLGWIWGSSRSANDPFFAATVVSSGLAANTWHHTAIVVSGNQATNGSSYYNGSLVSANGAQTSGGSTAWYGEFQNVNIGRGFVLSGRFFDGQIGEVRIYPRALTPAQVFQNYNATREKYTGVPASTDPGLTSTRTPA
jgi:hypothetical protein